MTPYQQLPAAASLQYVQTNDLLTSESTVTDTVKTVANCRCRLQKTCTNHWTSS